MDWIASPDAWVALLSLTALELVLGIDNIVFITILAGRLPEKQRPAARRIGLGLALAGRLLLLFSLAWITKLTQPLFEVFGDAISVRDLVLIVGGLFLLFKATREIHHKLEGPKEGSAAKAAGATFGAVLFQIFLLDLVFSLDSVITAVGMVDDVGVMATAIVLAVILMLVFAGPVGRFVDRHPTVRMLALSFLLLIGITLVADGFEVHFPRGYIYFAMGFSIFVEILNLKAGSHAPVVLHDSPRAPAKPRPE